MPIALLKDDFANLLYYQHWLSQAWENLSPRNAHFRDRYTEPVITATVRRDPDWFGSGVTFRELADGVTEYRNPQLIETVYNKVLHEVSADIVNRIKTRRLDFNALGLGVFSFDRAAMTLHRVKTATGQVKVRTATKELFAWFPKESRERHAVELFVSCDAPGDTTASQMLYSGVSAIIIAELLTKGGIRVKINIVNGSALSSIRDKYVGCVVPVKGYDEPVDRNLIALLTSDPRFMRFDAFKGVIAAFDHFQMSTPLSMGTAMNAAQLRKMFEESGYAKKSQAQHRYYFGGTFSEKQALRDVTLTINDLAAKLQEK